VIRRLCWLITGAVLGVTAYRRLCAAARALPAVGAARQVARFASDVREGMEIYMERQSSRAPFTLGGQQARAGLPEAGTGRARHIDHVKDGR
jgi:hypothetical protein